MRWARLPLVIGICVIGVSAVAGPLEDADAAHSRSDYATAVRLWQPLAEQGNADAQYHLAQMYEIGGGVPKDYAQALLWYRKAADQGNANAQYHLGLMYQSGRGVPKDYAQMTSWFRKAAETGHAQAKTDLEIAQSFAADVESGRKLAEQGDATAQTKLGIAYEAGRGISQDYAQAAAWFRKAADQGNARAQALLAEMYENGKGVPKDYMQAMDLYHKAAERGYAAAQFALGTMYMEGKGIPQDDALAVFWFRKAAVQDNVRAQISLGSMYEEGRSVPQDYVQAYKWFNLAALDRPHWLTVFGMYAKLKRDSLLANGLITPAQIDQAQRLSRQCYASGYADCGDPEIGAVTRPLVAGTNSRQSVPMKRKGDTYVVPVLINNAITLEFLVDSGASDVSIPEDVVSTLIRTGTIESGDFVGERTYILADGSKVKSRTFRIRSLKVGERVVENVMGSVAPKSGSLLLGQSFLGRHKSWSIDNTKHLLLLE